MSRAPLDTFTPTTFARRPCLVGATFHPAESSALDAILPHIGALEVTPDSLVVSTEDVTLDTRALTTLRALAFDIDIVAHGIGLSIASHDDWWDGYLRCLDQLLDAVPVAWHSEHLGYTRVNGEFLGTMLPAPRTQEMLDLLVDRVRVLQARYELPFLLENVVGLLPDYPGAYSDASFLNSLVEATGCGLLLDVYNLRCDKANRGLEIGPFLDELQLDAVVELHVAGGVSYRGFTLDVHSRTPEAATLELAAEIAPRCPNLRLVTYELLDEAVATLGTTRIVQSLTATREVVIPKVASVSESNVTIGATRPDGTH
ncbi:MAG: DUF692 family multinuclear iron-containing protein [Acidimicrobiales bacterium]